MAGRGSSGLLAALALLAFVVAPKSVLGAEGRRLPALFLFGDSLLDVGNNNFLPRSMAKANFPPNGIDFPGGKPTGRFSNGYNTADYLAKQYGFKRSPPAFLALNGSQLKRSICTGINFASAGSGILTATGTNLGETIPVDVQLDNFRTSLKSFTGRRCSMARRPLLSKSVFLLSAGTNDLFRFYNSNSSQTNLTTTRFITNLAFNYGRQLRTLYRIGARRFGILGLIMIGCCPALRRMTASGDCIAVLDDYAVQFNVALRKVLEEFSSKHERMKYSFGDGHKFGKMIAGNPLAYGFKEVKSACCGEGRLKGEAACTLNATLCSNRGNYYFWDWYHPSASAAKLYARLVYGGARALASPVSFGELGEG